VTNFLAWRRIRIPPLEPLKSYMVTEWNPVTWGHKYRDLNLQVRGLDAGQINMLCKKRRSRRKIYRCKIQISENWII
jgi:hypothetical protein